MSVKFYVGQNCEVSKLNQFLDKKVQMNSNPNITYSYQRFNWKIENEELVLFDGSEEENETYISNINQITNISDEMYKDVISISYDNDQTISICCLESRPILPHCNYCGEVIEQYEDFFELNTQCGFGSSYDGNNHKFKLHWNCFDKQFENLISKEVSTND
jgi:hypothetical protein